ncbi:MAG: glycosyltransferase family 2 protein [Burkholderiaceae bacterium]|jgi:glycosyltransferase involved in cell wall biosynthesis
MIGIVIPVHNEEKLLRECLVSVAHSQRFAGERGHPSFVIVVLDRCSDESREIAEEAGVQIMEIDLANVGAARSRGARQAILEGAQWLAFTDADSRVAPDWLVAQVELGRDAVVGTVIVYDWDSRPTAIQAAFLEQYKNADDHRHVHGANLGVSTPAYLACGGFPEQHLDEDVALVERLACNDFDIAWSAAPRVWTSARSDNRVSGGFGGFIANLEHRTEAGSRAVAPAES